jgi:MoxR-like ATPase
MTEIPVGIPKDLPRTGSWPAAVHVFDDKSANAVRMAIAAERPLLVRGEPGVGKSQLARAAAHVLGRLFVSEVVHARSEPQDLQWRFDAVARLGEAQALSAAGAGVDVQAALDPSRFLSPGVLWWTFDWESARRQHARCRHPERAPEVPAGWTADKGAVLLIDEIDKAEADLPNGLLETLGNGAFTVPYRNQPVRHAIGPPPLVVITTNEERELPGAFVRRCLVLHLALPAEEKECIAFLMQRGAQHFPGIAESVRKRAADQLWRDRQDARRLGLTPPGQAEYLDILRALPRMAAREPDQLGLLEEIAEFALKKAPRET